MLADDIVRGRAIAPPFLYLPTSSLSLPFSSVWKTIQSHYPHILQTHYRHLGHVTGAISNKKAGRSGSVELALRCSLYKDFPGISLALPPTVNRRRTKDCINGVAVKTKSRVSDYYITLIPRSHTIGITLKLCVSNIARWSWRLSE